MNALDHTVRMIRIVAFALLLCALMSARAAGADLLEREVGVVNGTVTTEGAFPSLTALLSGRGASIKLNQQQQINAKFFGHGLSSAFSGETVDCGVAYDECQGASGRICLITISQVYTDLVPTGVANTNLVVNDISPAAQLVNCATAGGVGAVFWLGDRLLPRTDMFDGLPSIPAVFINELQSNRLLVDAMRSESLHLEVQPNVAQTILCGATHLGDRWVLTAAHCVVEMTPDGLRKIQPWEITASVGAFDLTEDTNLSQAVEEIFLFDEIDTVANIQSDIALLKLAQQPSRLRNSISLTNSEILTSIATTATIEIATATTVNEHSLYSADAMVLGWGSTGVREANERIGLTDTTSAVPQAAWVSLVPVSQCTDLWRDYLGSFQNPVEVSPINDRQVCALEPVSQRDTCQGDSGGPLLIVVQDRLELAGITSFGVGCGSTSGVPAVYTKVSEYADWIAQITGINLSDAPEAPNVSVSSGDSIRLPVSSFVPTSGGGSLSNSLLLLILFVVSRVAGFAGRYGLTVE